MNDPKAGAPHDEASQPTGDGLLRRHPKLSILLIAGVFYAILFGLALVVFVLLVRG
jgi:hypothetical protein